MPGVRAFRDPLAAPKNKGLTNIARGSADPGMLAGLTNAGYPYQCGCLALGTRIGARVAFQGRMIVDPGLGSKPCSRTRIRSGSARDAGMPMGEWTAQTGKSGIRRGGQLRMVPDQLNPHLH